LVLKKIRTLAKFEAELKHISEKIGIRRDERYMSLSRKLNIYEQNLYSTWFIQWLPTSRNSSTWGIDCKLKLKRRATTKKEDKRDRMH
jgi:hypothetical protein